MYCHGISLFLLYAFVIVGNVISDNHPTVSRRISRKIHECSFDVCGGHSAHYKLVHVTAVNINDMNDTIHYIWSTIYLPSIIITHVMQPTKLNVNWTAIYESEKSNKFDGLSFTPTVLSTSGLTISRLFPYSDRDDDIKMKDSESDILSSFKWHLRNITEDVSKIVFEGQSSTYKQSSLIFELEATKGDRHGSYLPYNHVNGNMTQFNFTMIGLPVNPKDSRRYAVEILAFRGKNTTCTRHCDVTDKMYRYIDDEHSPGIFKSYSLLIPLPSSTDLSPSRVYQTHISWKPVAYNDVERNLKHQVFTYEYSSMASYSQDDNLTRVLKPKSIGNFFIDEVEYYGLNITMGLPEDGFYKGYMSWTALVGAGIPQSETVSDLIWIIIAAGLGSPVVVILFSLFIILIRSGGLIHNENYEPIQ